MASIDLPLDLKAFDKKGNDYNILLLAEQSRGAIASLMEDERYMDALERSVAMMRDLREFSDFENKEFRAIFAATLFDLAEIHYSLKDYRQSEKELETLFKVLGKLAKEDPERFGEFHILAMELAARIIRSRKKAIETLIKEKLNTEALYEKVNAGISSATDRLVESLRKVGELMAASGAYKEALKFYAEAVKFSKDRSGKVGRLEIALTIEMAEVMSRVKSMRQRARRLLAAVLPHAIALEIVELEEQIISLMEMIDKPEEQTPRWKTFLNSLSYSNLKSYISRGESKQEESSAGKEKEESED
ncbi:MAG: hypothetical protein HDR48_04710 [Bacteroides sp.]|nr:hypothetical protein [Bacteroides sp.]MBD5419317.1 hypothetical protein [Bacteroides sp.]MDE7462921.1 hypothetical protein [Muribaculaceae bacterium]